MALRSAPLWLLGWMAVAVQESRFGSSLPSLKYFFIAISDLNQGLPDFVTWASVDGQVVIYYDSNNKEMQPQISWMEKMENEEPQYWHTQTQILRLHEQGIRSTLHSKIPFKYETEGLHMLQVILSCDLQGDGSKRGILQEAYNGETSNFFILDDSITENCIELLEKCLSYGNEMLLRTEPPVVTMSSRTEVEDGMETHVCRLDGFYPREIDASWRRDGEVWLEDTFQGSVAPNADGTHHYWLSIWIDPKERGRYRCHVEHDGLQEPLDVALKESNLGLIVGCVVAVLVLTCVIVGTLMFFRCLSSGQGKMEEATSI